MKRKNTKVYKELVKRYCENRYEIEQREDNINEHNRIIEENNEWYNALNDDIKSNVFIRTWFHEFIKMHEVNVIFARQVIDHFANIVEGDAETLKNDYGEDLDALYKSYQNSVL